WEETARTSPPAAQPTGSGCVTDHESPLTSQVKCMWSLRDLLRRLGEDIHTWRQGPPPAGAVFQAWATATRLQTHTRALRKACRSRKIVAIAEAVSATNIHQAARRFAPKAPRRRLQLRKADGSLQTHEEELHQISEYFTKLYDGTPGTHRPCLTQDLQISQRELQGALLRLQPSKAMPSNSAPAALWKHFGQDVLPLMERLFAQYLVAGCRLQPYVAAYLTDIPQFAYVAQRSLSQALERVISHCAAVRTLVQQHVQTPHTRRQGRPNLSLYGGCQLSLDITCAYDHVPRWALEAAVRDAHIPETLIQAVLLIHDQAFVRITHCGQETSFKLRRGLRQGCGLAPILWSLYSGWVLKQMHSPPILDVSTAATTYADDQHYAWLIRKGQDLENAYQAMKHVFRCLLDNDMQISVDKTVILLELQGPQATKALARYVVQRPTGPHMKFVIQGASMLIKLVTRHVYLGAVITYRRFEQESYRHRLKLAKNSYTRLGKILRNHSVPMRLRLQLWQGCIWPAILHGLDCTGMPQPELQSLNTQLIKQARSIARSHSMLTRETNVDLVRRLESSPTQSRGSEMRFEQLQWRALVRGQLFETSGSPWGACPSLTISSKLVCVEKVIHEIFTCEDCGQQFATPAALKRHQFCMHMTADQKEARTQEVQQARKHSPMEHSKDGMPQCRHCGYAFTTWHAFFYHVSSRSCEFLRAIYSSTQAAELTPLLSEALVDSPALLDLAKDCTWQDLALHAP
ncbi:unnamed protein product, partial [Symbiodinium sp. CCMP2456]